METGMKFKIKNLTNSPFDIRVVGGTKRLGAREEGDDFEIDPLYLPHYKRIGYLELTEIVEEVESEEDESTEEDETSDEETSEEDTSEEETSEETSEKVSEESTSEETSEEAAASSRDELRAQYKDKFGKNPPANWSTKQIADKLAEE